MEEEAHHPRRKHVRIKVYHIHHYHHHRRYETSHVSNTHQTNKTEYTYARTTARHQHNHPPLPENDDMPNNQNESPNNLGTTTPTPLPNNFPFDDINDEPKYCKHPPKKNSKMPKQNQPNSIHRPQSNQNQDTDEYPYPIQTLGYLKDHPLPDNSEGCNDQSNNEPEKTDFKLRFISDYPKYNKNNSTISNKSPFWDETEAALIQERMGGYQEIPPKQLPMMYPFTEMSPRKLPWDFSDVELVPTRPNKPFKPPKPRSMSYFETSILEMMRVPTPLNQVLKISSKSDEFDNVQSWIKTVLGSPYTKLLELGRCGTSTVFTEFERTHDNITLVLFPCNSPVRFLNETSIPDKIVTYRFVSKGFDLLRILKRNKIEKGSFLLCAVDLGKAAYDDHPKCIPTDWTIQSLISNGYDSFFFKNNGVESIMILNTTETPIIPLYIVKMAI